MHHHLSLQDIAYLGAIQINPYRDDSMESTHIICAQYGITLPNMHRYTSMSSYLFPHAPYDRLLTIDLLNAVLFYIDDVYDRNASSMPSGHDQIGGEIFENCARIFANGQRPASHHELYPIWQELHRRFRAQSSPAYMQRLILSLSDHFQAITIPNKAFSEVDDQAIQGYIAARVHDSGMYPTMLLIEFAAGIEIDQAVQMNPVIQRATYLTAVIAALLNDLFSYEKEVQRLDSRFNIIRILMDGHHIQFVEAVHRSVLMINRLTAEFQSIETARPDFGFPELNHQVDVYMGGLRDQLAAAWHWQLNTNRYRSPESPFDLLREQLPEISLSY